MAETDRKTNGTFAKGNSFGDGRSRMSHLRSKLLHSVSAEDAIAVLKAIRTKALRGNMSAAKLYLTYTVGVPTWNMDDNDRKPTKVQVNFVNLRSNAEETAEYYPDDYGDDEHAAQ